MHPSPLPAFKKKPSKGLSLIAFLVAVIILLLAGFASYFALLIADYNIKLLPQILDTKSNKFKEDPHAKIKELNRVYDVEGNLIHEFSSGEDRIYVSLEDISDWAKKAVIASEDVRFYDHPGYDIRAMLRAMWKNLRTGDFSEGGSTITQQLARNVYLGTTEKTITRKIKEIILARKIEQFFTKDEILEFYLNQVYFGSQAYGIESASKKYFGASAKNLTLSQASMLAGVLTSPSDNNPFDNLNVARQAQHIVLEKMRNGGLINDVQLDQAFADKLKFNKPKPGDEKLASQINYFIDFVKEELYQRMGQARVEKGGLDIHTTINPTYQRYAEQAVHDVIDGAVKRGEFGKVYTDRFDVEQPQAAICAIDVKTGRILAMVGGRDYSNTQFNRCTALRQPGSSFKIFVYSAALETGTLFPDSHLRSSPITIGDWQPKEWFTGYFGTVTVRYAIQESSNICAIRAGLMTGLDRVIQIAKRMGVSKSKLLAVPSLSIGSVEVKPIEMASAGQTLGNLGSHIEPYSITSIMDRKSAESFPTKVGISEALSKETAYDMIDMLKGVLKYGTGVTAYVDGVPCAGKTGTTQSFRDGWFVGFTPEVSAAVYVGSDSKDVDLSFVKNYGSKYSAVVWKEFIKKVSSGRFIADWQAPERERKDWVSVCAETNLVANPTCTGLRLYVRVDRIPTKQCPINHPRFVKASVCKDSGKLAREYCSERELKVFKKDVEPKEFCDIHTKPATEEGKPGDETKKPGDEGNKPPDATPKPEPKPEPKPKPGPKPEPKPQPKPESESEPPARFFYVTPSASSARTRDPVRFDYLFNYDNVGSIAMYADGVEVGSMMSFPWSIIWVPSASRTYNLVFSLYDTAGNLLAQYFITYTVTP